MHTDRKSSAKSKALDGQKSKKQAEENIINAIKEEDDESYRSPSAGHNRSKSLPQKEDTYGNVQSMPSVKRDGSGVIYEQSADNLTLPPIKNRGTSGNTRASSKRKRTVDPNGFEKWFQVNKHNGV